MKVRALLLACLVTLAFVFTNQAAVIAKEVTVRGKLGRTVEPGGWVINTDKQKYLILNPEKFQKESWFREDAEVEAVGEAKPGAITTYMEGTPFQVTSMKPLSGSSSSSNVTGPADGSGAKASTRVSVMGDATVKAQPDTALITIAVVTQNRSASEAQAENASKTDTVVRTVKEAAGATAEVKTSGYSLQPQYIYKQNESPTISGYLARNSVIVTMSDLNKVGTVIDAATRAGANNIDNLSFTLRRDRPARDQALKEATSEAMSKAKVIAEALGGRLVRIIAVEEAGTPPYPPIPLRADYEMLKTASPAQAPTPIEVGTLDIRAQVQIVAEISTQ